MKLKEIQTKIQDFAKISKSELFISILILAGLAVGAGYKTFVVSEKEKLSADYFDAINHSLDSFAAVQQSAYIGGDNEGESMSELKAGDTLIKPEFPQKVSDKVKGDETVNINTASLKELMKLPGIGESTAQKIIEERAKRKFARPDDIMNVKGIGEKKYEKMKAHIITK